MHNRHSLLLSVNIDWAMKVVSSAMSPPGKFSFGLWKSYLFTLHSLLGNCWKIIIKPQNHLCYF